MEEFYGNSLGLPIRYLCLMFDFILEYNFFKSDNQIYLQIHDTAIGTTFAPNYSGVFLGNFEYIDLNNAPNNLNPLFGNALLMIFNDVDPWGIGTSKFPHLRKQFTPHNQILYHLLHPRNQFLRHYHLFQFPGSFGDICQTNRHLCPITCLLLSTQQLHMVGHLQPGTRLSKNHHWQQALTCTFTDIMGKSFETRV